MRPANAERRSCLPVLSTTTTTLLGAILAWSPLACGPADGEPWAAEEGPVWTLVQAEPSYPEHRQHCWSHEAQGVTHDKDNWYVSTWGRMFKYPVTADLGQCGYSLSVAPPEWSGDGCPGKRCECGHFGDISFHGDLLYAPLEDCYVETDKGQVRIADRVFAYDRNLKVVTSATFDPQVQADASWVAVHPQTGEIWSSYFDSDHVNVYSSSFRPHAQLRLVRTVDLGKTYRAVQGAAFDDDGVLYLVSGDTVEPDLAGIYLFTFPSESKARAQQFIPPPANYRPGFGYWDELEGITVWDVSEKNAPHIRGQIHWLMLDNDAGQDDVSFMHASVARTFPAVRAR